MLKKLISMTLTCAMVLTSASAIFGISASAATELTPTVFDRTQKASTYQTQILDEDFSDYTEETAFTSTDMDVVLDNKSTGNVATATVKKDSDNNKYIRITAKQDADWNVRLMKSFTATGNSILFGFDYRSASATLAYYSSSLAVNGEIRSNGTSIRHKANDVSMAQVGGTITTTENGAERWVKVQMLIVPSNQIIHFWVDGEYHGSSAFRKSATTLNQLWIGCNGTDKSIDIDNMSIINMGTTDDTWYKFDEVEKLTFDYVEGSTDIPFTTSYTNAELGGASIVKDSETNDGCFYMWSATNKNASSNSGVGMAHYNYTLKSSVPNVSKISFRFRMDLADSTGQIQLYLTPDNIATITIEKTRIKSYDGSTNKEVKTGLTLGDGQWHTLEIIADSDNDQFQFVIDGVVADGKYQYRKTKYDYVDGFYMRAASTNANNKLYIDDFTVYEDGTVYFEPTLKSDVLSIDSANHLINMTDAQAGSYTLETIKNILTVDSGVTVAVGDKDSSGGISNGDTVTLTSSLGNDYVYTITIVAPTLSSDTLTIDNDSKTITFKQEIAEGYASMNDIANDITGTTGYNVTVTDVNGDGDLSDGDTVTVTSTASGSSYTYTIEVLESYEVCIESLIVKGEDGQGDNFEFNEKAQPNFIQTVTKAGDAEVTCRVQNNTDSSSITPFVAAAVYNDDGKLVSVDKIDNVAVTAGSYKDFELNVTVPSALSAGKLKVFVWKSASTQMPLINSAPKEYAINTNEFTVPNIISNNMILQRNSTVNIFGTAPQGSTVTATLTDSGNNVVATASDFVAAGSNEFCAELDLTEQGASTEGLNLTITANEQEKSFTGILLGDVYYGSGQSNMTRGFSSVKADIAKGICDNYEPAEGSGDTYATLAAQYETDYKALGDSLRNVRYFSVKVDNSVSRASISDSTVSSAEVWKTVSSSNISGMSEILVRLAGYMQTLSDSHENVPVGLVMSAQGGTKIDKWVSKDVLVDHEAFDGTQEREDYYANKRNDGPNVTPYRWASPADLYYDCVRPVMPYTFKAAVWYQGESDSSTQYDKFLAAMIDEHRAGFHSEELPFLVVQLPGYCNGQNVSDGAFSGSGLPLKRLLQDNVKKLTDNVYVVVTNDSGDDGNIHPANKDVVSERLARVILNQLDKVDIPYTGPQFSSVSYTEGTATVTVSLDDAGTLREYTVTQGSNFFDLYDGTTWYRADDISVSGKTITVKYTGMTTVPTGIRYAYGPEIVKCIYGDFGDGVELPLVPFDTTYVGNTWNN